MKLKAKEKKWKSEKKLPRILKINRVKGLTISVLFSNGQNRILNFDQIFKDWGVTRKDKEYKLLDPNEFKKVKLEGFTLSWDNIRTEIDGFDGKIEIPYQVSADTLYELSEPDTSREEFPIGAMIRRERIRAGLTQEELAERIGSDKYYISKVESDQFHIEIATLKKIIEGGLHKKLEIRIK